MTARSQTYVQTESTTETDRSQLLRNILKANAAFSFISGLLLTFASGSIAEFLGIEESSILGVTEGDTALFVMGLLILVFGADVLFVATRKTLSRFWATEIMVADVLWVVASGVLLLTGALPFTTEGSWAILIVADIVLTFAVLEWWGLRRMKG